MRTFALSAGGVGGRARTSREIANSAVAAWGIAAPRAPDPDELPRDVSSRFGSCVNGHHIGAQEIRPSCLRHETEGLVRIIELADATRDATATFLDLNRRGGDVGTIWQGHRDVHNVVDAVEPPPVTWEIRANFLGPKKFFLTWQKCEPLRETKKLSV